MTNSIKGKYLYNIFRFQQNADELRKVDLELKQLKIDY